MLGIIIGVGSIITVVAIGQGGEVALKSQFVGSGNQTVPIHYSPDINDPFGMDMSEAPKITEEDIFEIKKIPEIAHIVTTNSSMESLDIENKKEMVSITGLDNEYFKVNKVKVLKGRLLQESDVEQGNNVVIISKQMEDEVFNDVNPVGKIIELKGGWAKIPKK